MKDFIQKILRKFGYQFCKYPPLDVRRRLKIVEHHDISLILDVGANAGQYAREMRENGYGKKIISFEPLNAAYEKLSQKTRNDINWTAKNFALGDRNEISKINISGHSLSSSILDMMPEHLKYAPESDYVDQQEIEIKTLDHIFDSLHQKNDVIMLKVDTQGYEQKVIEGASGSLNKILLLQLEMSLFTLYKGEILISGMMDLLKDQGFRLISLENGIYDHQTGELLQTDGIFLNESLKSID